MGRRRSIGRRSGCRLFIVFDPSYLPNLVRAGVRRGLRPKMEDGGGCLCPDCCSLAAHACPLVLNAVHTRPPRLFRRAPSARLASHGILANASTIGPRLRQPWQRGNVLQPVLCCRLRADNNRRPPLRCVSRRARARTSSAAEDAADSSLIDISHSDLWHVKRSNARGSSKLPSPSCPFKHSLFSHSLLPLSLLPPPPPSGALLATAHHTLCPRSHRTTRSSSTSSTTHTTALPYSSYATTAGIQAQSSSCAPAKASPWFSTPVRPLTLRSHRV